MYSYNTPEEAILSLEKAYMNKDLKEIINSKDFIEEAKFILEQADFKYDLNDVELIKETAKLAELSLIKNLQENGFDYSEQSTPHSEA